MPVFAIVLEESFLFTKAAIYGKEVIFEKDNTEKYESFKKYVTAKIVKSITNTIQISPIIHSQLDAVINDEDYHLIGWKKANNIFCDYTDMNEAFLYQSNQKIIESILNQKFPLADKNSISSFAFTFSDGLKANFNGFHYILNTSERHIQLAFIDGSKQTIRVTITKTFEYFYLNNKEHFFSINFNATQQQAETYKVHSLIIDNTDFTSQVELSIDPTENRGQFMYKVKSNKIPVSLVNSKVVFVASYECPPLDFFQSHRLSCLCKHFKTTIHLNEDLRQQYTLLCSTFSPFSKMHYDDYKAGEILKPYDGQIVLPNWSFPGSGYVATLKYKTAKNHV